MLTLIPTFATFVATTIAAFLALSIIYEWVWGNHRIIRSRMDALNQTPETTQTAALFDNSSDTPVNVVQRCMDRTRKMLLLANVDVSATLFIQFQLATGIATSLVSYVLYPNAFVIPITCLTGLLLPIVYLKIKIRRKLNNLVKHLPEAFDILSRSVKSGQTIEASLQIVAEEFQPPISTEFARCVSQTSFGVAKEKVYREMATKFPSKEMKILMLALIIQSRVGGSMTTLLENLSETVRCRIRLRGKLRALTGEGKTQANVMMFLPFAALAAIQLIAPKYAEPLWENPQILLMALILQALGMFWIYRIVNALNFSAKGS